MVTVTTPFEDSLADAFILKLAKTVPETIVMATAKTNNKTKTPLLFKPYTPTC